MACGVIFVSFHSDPGNGYIKQSAAGVIAVIRYGPFFIFIVQELSVNAVIGHPLDISQRVGNGSQIIRRIIKIGPCTSQGVYGFNRPVHSIVFPACGTPFRVCFAQAVSVSVIGIFIVISHRVRYGSYIVCIVISIGCHAAQGVGYGFHQPGLAVSDADCISFGLFYCGISS